LNWFPSHDLEADVFVCATRGEGFNLPGLEAKACGLPTIQTKFGGQLDYMDESDVYVRYDLKPVQGDIMYEEVSWAIPDVEHLKKLMRTEYENRNIKRIESKDLNKWSWGNVAKKVMEELK
jgi:glycosyltransferase involved in cell wall biosynthesis